MNKSSHKKIHTRILQGSEIWAPEPPKTDLNGLKFDTQNGGSR